MKNQVLAVEIEKLDKEENLNARLFNAAYSAERDIRKLYEMAEFIKDKMDRVMNYCESAKFSENLEGRFYLGVNSLGELQSSAGQFEIQCALACRSVDDFNAARKGY